MSYSTPKPEHPSLSTTLLAGIKQMQPEAWNRLVETFGPIVYRWCRQSGVNAHDSSDIVQDVFVSVARGIGGFQRIRAQGSFRSWLATIVRNRIRDFYRRDLPRRPQVEGGTAFLAQLREIPEDLDESIDGITGDALEQQLPRRVLQLVRTEVEPRTWKAFWLTTVEDRPITEVAEELKMQKASIYQARSRVLRRIRQRLAELP